MIYLQLFFEYFKIGLFAVGGGQATIPFLVDLSEKTGWYTLEELANMIAISESTPGPIGVNMSTYVGYKIAGIFGSVVASMGLILPSLISILIIAIFLEKFKDSKGVKKAFYGIRPASTGLIAAALFTLLRLCLVNEAAFSLSGNIADLFNIKFLICFAAMMALMNVKKIKDLHPICFVAFAAIIGIIFKF